jgi:hypothetical protein
MSLAAVELYVPFLNGFYLKPGSTQVVWVESSLHARTPESLTMWELTPGGFVGIPLSAPDSGPDRGLTAASALKLGEFRQNLIVWADREAARLQGELQTVSAVLATWKNRATAALPASPEAEMIG